MKENGNTSGKKSLHRIKWNNPINETKSDEMPQTEKRGWDEEEEMNQ